MKLFSMKKQQKGIALIMVLIFLFVLTMLSIYSASNSSLELKMAGNMQDSYSSFQSAEAGAIATMALSGTSIDPFIQWIDSTAEISLTGISGIPDNTEVSIRLSARASPCPRSSTGFSSDLLVCNYYDIASKHSVSQKPETEVHIGVVKTIIQKKNL